MPGRSVAVAVRIGVVRVCKGNYFAGATLDSDVCEDSAVAGVRA